MVQQIYKVFMVRFLEAWYQLSKEEQNNLIAKVNEALGKVGGKRPLLCNSSWSSDQWSFAGLPGWLWVQIVTIHSLAEPLSGEIEHLLRAGGGDVGRKLH